MNQNKSNLPTYLFLFASLSFLVLFHHLLSLAVSYTLPLCPSVCYCETSLSGLLSLHQLSLSIIPTPYPINYPYFTLSSSFLPLARSHSSLFKLAANRRSDAEERQETEEKIAPFLETKKKPFFEALVRSSPSFYHFISASIAIMEEQYYKRSHVPAFGSWDWDDNLQFTQCFESARQAGLLRNSYSESEDRDLYVAGDLYENDVVIPAMIVVPRRRAKVRRQKEKEAKTQNWVSNEEEPSSPTAPLPRPNPKPVDEDLYKISPELLYAKTRKKRGLSFFSSCLLPTCSV